MPYHGSAGYSVNTPVKQENFEVIIRTHLRIVKSLFARGWRTFPQYVYMDLNAGPGFVNGTEGSPLIFLRVAREEDIPAHAYFYEKDPDAAARLREAVGRQYGIGGWEVIEGDHTATAPAVMHRLSWTIDCPVYGLVYADPNATLLPIRPMQAILANPHFRKVDVLAHLSGTGYKRVGKGNELLADLAAVGKECIWLRRPRDRDPWDWSFAILSGWEGFPAFRKQGFRPLGTPEGAEIADHIRLKRTEFQQRGQTALPFADGPSLPTEATPSIFGIPGSGPSAPKSSAERQAAASAATPGHQLSLTI